MTTFLEISSFIEPQVLLHRPTSSMTTSESSPESCSSWSELTNQLSASGAQSTSPRITYKDLNPEYWRFLCLVLALIPTSLGSNLSWGPLGLLWILSGPRVINSSPSYLVWSFVELRHSTDCHSLILTGENFENSQELQLKVMLSPPQSPHCNIQLHQWAGFLAAALPFSFPIAFWRIPEYTWRRNWQPTPAFLPGEFRGQKSLAGYSPQGRKESDTTKRLTHTHRYP